MDAQMILTPVPLADLMAQMRVIVRDELQQQQTTDLKEKLLSPGEACELLGGITKVTLWAWEKAGRIKKHTIGGKVFYKYGELISSLETIKRYGRAAAV